jgi:hypothetical protein
MTSGEREVEEGTVKSQLHRVAFYADIFYQSELSPAYWIPPANLDVEAILLGGDIHYSPQGLGAMLSEIRETQPDTTWIIVVPGNGEYIDQELAESRQQYRAAVESVPNTCFLDDDAVVLPNGVRIIGSTLWSLVPDSDIDGYAAMLLSEYGMQGVDNIRLGSRDLTLRDTNELHQAARSFIAGELRSLSAAEREKTIVCTHFWPTLQPWLDRPDDPDFRWLHMVGSDMDALLAESGPRFWLCGHAHTTQNVTIGDTLVSSNPRAGDGEGNVNPEFVESYVVEL